MKNTKAGFIKGRRMLFALMLVLVLVAPMLAPHPAQAAGQCPAPGTGLGGAYNMTLDATMWDIMYAHVPSQGWAGMVTAVVNTACPSP